ncbi:hypothetical protein IWW36_000149 [Coemansia brasiliensis]|uniref:Uncharacterized protein n=1 Tax=Coemansia brasiliensis TaxID=2650707 RepID=A0A9W8IHT1_9FUNG|nr:hypothetical protein IWW36_000149 [Coemansia brasiliensis]
MSKHNKKANNSLLDVSDSNTAPFIFDKSPQRLDSAGQPPKTYRVEPPSELLTRLHAFLPQIAKANKELGKDSSKLNMENVGEDDPQYIEMDLGLGVFDMKPKKPITLSAKNEECSSDELQPNVIIDPSEIASRQRPKPNIEVLHAGSSSSDGDSESSSGAESSSDSDEEMGL